MKLIGSVLLLAACLLGVYALPTQSNDANHALKPHVEYELLVQQMRSSLIDTRAQPPGGKKCADDYNKNINSTTSRVVKLVNACFEEGSNNAVVLEKNVNKTVNQVRSDMLAVSKQIDKCLSLKDTENFLYCTTDSYDTNLRTLDAATTNAYYVKAKIDVNHSQVNIDKDACINSVTSEGKMQLITATNDYNKCLWKIQL